MTSKPLGIRRRDTGSRTAAVSSIAAVPAAPAPEPVARRQKLTGAKLTAREFGVQLARAAAALEEALEKRDLSLFYRVFRDTDLPFLGPAYSEDPRGLYDACFDVLRHLGSISPAVGVAVYNHYAVTCPLSTFPIRNDPALAARRQAVLRSIVENRQLVANTTTRIHTDKVGSFGARARREGDSFRVSGTAAYMSLATESDVVILYSEVEDGGHALFMAPLRDNPQIEIGPFLFPTAMIESDTRRVTFHDTFVSVENMLMTDSSIGTFQVAWHQVLLAAPFLGAAGRALEEARKFLRSVRAPNDKPMAELDGMIVDVGRLAIQYRSACSMAHQVGQALESIARRPPDLASFTDAFHFACAAKQFCTKSAEEIVTAVRRIIGGRSFSGSHPMERISQEVMFAPLAGEINAVIERRLGRLILGEEEVLSRRW